MLKLRNIRKGEHNRKKRWKIKNANKSFFQNPYQAGKNILDPKCNIKLTVDKGTLDKHNASSVADPLHNIPLPPLKDLPEQPIPFFAVPHVFAPMKQSIVVYQVSKYIRVYNIQYVIKM